MNQVLVLHSNLACWVGNEAFIQDMNLRERAKTTLGFIELSVLSEEYNWCVHGFDFRGVCVDCRKFISPCIIFSRLFELCPAQPVAWFRCLCVTVAILKEWYKRCLVCFMWHSAFYLVQINLWYLWVKPLSWVSLKLSINGQWHIFQQVVTCLPSAFSLSSSIAPLTFNSFTNATHLSTHPSCEIQFQWENLLYFERQVRRKKNTDSCFSLQ